MIQKEHVTITKDKRVLVPESLKKLGVQFEHDVNTITFTCPRFWSMADKLKQYFKERKEICLRF